MSTEQNIESKDQETLSQKIPDKYASYAELNQEESDTSGNVEPVSEVKETKVADEKQVTEESSTKESVHKPRWQKRIDKQSAKIKMLEAQLAQLNEEKSKHKEMPKYKRDNFVTEEEYDEYNDKRTESMFNKQLTERKERELLDAKRMAEDEAFNNNWQEKVNSNFEGDQEGYAEFAQLIKQNSKTINGWHQDIHDYMEATDVGPRMMQVMLIRPDIAEQMSNAKPIVRMKLLNKLESEIEAVMYQPRANQTTSAKPAVSKAPAPIGTVGTSGNVLSDDESEDVAYQRYMNKKFRGK